MNDLTRRGLEEAIKVVYRPLQSWAQGARRVLFGRFSREIWLEHARRSRIGATRSGGFIEWVWHTQLRSLSR